MNTVGRNTYLRFHADELIFLGILIRVLNGFPALKKFWTKPYNSKNAQSNLVFPDFDAGEIERIKDAFNKIKGIKDDSNNPIKTWISIGLVEYYIKSNKMPAWFIPKDFKTTSSDYNDRSKQSAVALDMLTIIMKYNLVATLNFVLEFTPIVTFFDKKIFENGKNPAKKLFMSKVFTKAHSFERVRLVYKAANEKPVKKTD